MAEHNFFVLDAVTHAFNLTEENFADVDGARAMAEMVVALGTSIPESQYAMTREVVLRDWTTDELANVLFRESTTDVAVYHPLPIFSFKDGLSSLEKAVDVMERYPTRFIGSYACVDPLRGQEALDELERQVELFKPLGLKMYPASWHNGKVGSWKMNDPKVAYPVIQKAGELGLRHVAVHKSIPIEPVEFRDAFNPADFEGAAVHFPEMNFEIVHGGIAFVEETALLLARFPNIFVNMENLNMVVARRPRVFAQILLGLMREGGDAILERLFWGTGTVQYHPKPCVEAMAAFEFPEDLLEGAGLYAPLSQITDEAKAGLFAGNFARLHDIDLDQVKARIADDAFAQGQASGLAEPWSSVAAASLSGV
jgi:predicted TIM-barrel fold metal-dependent hydrolase